MFLDNLKYSFFVVKECPPSECKMSINEFMNLLSLSDNSNCIFSCSGFYNSFVIWTSIWNSGFIMENRKETEQKTH